MPEEYVVVLSTLPADRDAAALATALVDARLAACVNILSPVTSIYRWQDAVETAREQKIVIKTARTRVPELWEKVRSLHPYDVPEFIVLPIVDGNEAYLSWIGESCAVRQA
jgi:periplasmic divalent cation tolerance protein